MAEPKIPVATCRADAMTLRSIADVLDKLDDSGSTMRGTLEVHDVTGCPVTVAVQVVSTDDLESYHVIKVM